MREGSAHNGTRWLTRWNLAAKAALKRKKQHEHTHEQTQSQIVTLEQQINSIESANINRETLAAMEKAGEAMKTIHGKLTPEKVDETMYVAPATPKARAQLLTFGGIGRSSGNRMRSARRLSRRSRPTRSARRMTMRIWTPSWRSCSRSSWTSRCWIRATCPCRTRCTRCPLWRTARVSPFPLCDASFPRW
ncbi:Snf7 family protein [Candidatus Bathyarchaeota archaeon]|nr:Snf7 family protein [Candidatus Bathyarchaeota archaeon]